MKQTHESLPEHDLWGYAGGLCAARDFSVAGFRWQAVGSWLGQVIAGAFWGFRVEVFDPQGFGCFVFSLGQAIRYQCAEHARLGSRFSHTEYNIVTAMGRKQLLIIELFDEVSLPKLIVFDTPCSKVFAQDTP